MRATPPNWNPYKVLGLQVGADGTDVRKAFRRLAKMYHPDVPDSGDATAFDSIRRAADDLSTTAGRARWSNPANARMSGKWSRRTRAKVVRRRDVRLDPDLMEEDFFTTFCREAAELNDLPPDAYRSAQQPSDGMEAKGITEQWLERKRQRRLLRRREDLGGDVSEPRPVVWGAASEDTVSRIRAELAQWLGVTPSMLGPETSLEDLGFYDASASEDLAKVLMELEDIFDVDLADVVDGRQIKFDLPGDVTTVSGFADFVESKL